MYLASWTALICSFLLFCGCSEGEQTNEKNGPTLSDNIEVICAEWPTLSLRETTIVLDSSSIDLADQDHAWFNSLVELSFSERETVRVIVLDPATSSATLALETCYPSFTAEEKSKNSGDWQTASLERRERDLLTAFGRQLEDAAVIARDKSEKSSGADLDVLTILPDLDTFFEGRKNFHRIIIFSELKSELLDSALESLTESAELENISIYGQYALDFGLAEIMVFGFGENTSSLKSKFWKNYFEQNGTIVSSISKSLARGNPDQVDQIFSFIGRWELSTNENENGPARLQAAVSSSSGSIPIGTIGILGDNGWIYAPFQGSYGCSAVDSECKFTARISSTVPTGTEDPFFEKDIDKLELSGTSSELRGELIPGIELDTPQSSDATYVLSFSSD